MAAVCSVKTGRQAARTTVMKNEPALNDAAKICVHCPEWEKGGVEEGWGRKWRGVEKEDREGSKG